MVVYEKNMRLSCSGKSCILQDKIFVSTCWMLAVFMLLVFFSTGCAGDSQTSDENYFRLNLGSPEVEEKKVTVNGGVVAPVDRIEWDWGDGEIIKHHFFPASHTYSNPGQYKIKVTVFDRKHRTSTKSVEVEVK